MSNPNYQRPLSPFMMYRWQYTNTLSILHRVTGCALSLGLLLFVYWLVAAASGPEEYAYAQHVVFAHPITRVELVGFTFAFFYHLMNGVRHLVWDAGHGFEKKQARLSGWVAFLGAIVLTALLWFLLARGGAA